MNVLIVKKYLLEQKAEIQKVEIQTNYDRLLNIFLDYIFEVNKDLIDDIHFAK